MSKAGSVIRILTPAHGAFTLRQAMKYDQAKVRKPIDPSILKCTRQNSSRDLATSC